MRAPALVTATAAGVVAFGVLTSGMGCRARSAPVAATAAPEGGARPPATREPPRLPEDPVGAQIASAQWRDHLAREERERRLGYDRRHLGEHRVVLAAMRADRARYDRARTRTAVRRLQARMPASIAAIRRDIQRIDHWGVNSNLLEDYAAMLEALSTQYPAARSAALAGQRAPLSEMRADWRRREKRIADWLTEAAASTDVD